MRLKLLPTHLLSTYLLSHKKRRAACAPLMLYSCSLLYLIFVRFAAICSNPKWRSVCAPPLNPENVIDESATFRRKRVVTRFVMREFRHLSERVVGVDGRSRAAGQLMWCIIITSS